MIYWQLFFSYLKIGFFGFGGGYAMISLIYNEMVDKHAWLTGTELSDIVAVSQMTPGPIAINCATFVGYSVTGNVWGSVLSTTAVCLPPLSIMLLISYAYVRLQNNLYLNGILYWMKPVMAGMIGAAALMFLNAGTFIDWKSVVLFAACALAIWKKVDPVLIIIASAGIGLLLYR